MKLAIIGSRKITSVDIASHIPKDVTEIVSGGAKGVDTLAKAYAENNGIKLTEFLPDYQKFKRGAPLKKTRKLRIIPMRRLFFGTVSQRGQNTPSVFSRNKKRALRLSF